MESNDLDIIHFELMIFLASFFNTLPAQILEHQYSPCSFGSWWCTFRKSGKIYRITYDGRDGFISLEIDISNSHISGKPDWKDIGHKKAEILYNNENIMSGIKSLLSEYHLK